MAESVVKSYFLDLWELEELIDHYRSSLLKRGNKFKTYKLLKNINIYKELMIFFCSGINLLTCVVSVMQINCTTAAVQDKISFHPYQRISMKLLILL